MKSSVVRDQGASLGMPETVSPSNVPLSTSRSHSPCAYQIEEVKESECARVIFARHMQTSTRRVIKILRPYQDTRYSLGTLEERQRCQLEALSQNRRFTPEVYLGLAPVEKLDLENEQISLGHVLENPTPEMLESGCEYALVMQQLPENDRLDHVLQKGKRAQLQGIMQLLAEKITFLHLNLASFLPEQGEKQWGGNEQLQKKLLHNFDLLDSILTTYNDKNDEAYRCLENRLFHLKEKLYAVFTIWKARGYFEWRVAEQRIKRCHGDLKSPNIWVFPRKRGWGRNIPQTVLILDGADFNASYTHIDILSDIALLAVDIHARTAFLSPALADQLMQSYLRLTNQRDEGSQAVLSYYLVEKAIVGAAVSLVYDHLPELGHAFLHVAEQRLEDLMRARSV
jgi:aminoglycoside phosphotransferase family enzyme